RARRSRPLCEGSALRAARAARAIERLHYFTFDGMESTMTDLIAQLTQVSLGASVAGLVLAAFFYFRVKSLPEGTETMNMIGRYIREGAMAFLVREYKVLAVYAIVVFAFLFFAFRSEGTGLLAGGCFLLGAFLSLLSGFIGMKAATYANVRTSQAAR